MGFEPRADQVIWAEGDGVLKGFGVCMKPSGVAHVPDPAAIAAADRVAGTIADALDDSRPHQRRPTRPPSPREAAAG
jgi:uncharacterized protein YfaA (DUF2138 family)